MRDVSGFLEQFVSRASDREDVHAVGLAGSWARGTATPDSDVDLVVIVEHVPRLLTTSQWVALPLDPGTRQVVADGFEVLYDPDGLLRRCKETGP
ncbi:MAG: nucleotidyltransferase domain-containing protein [Actinomycetota bacterium]